MTSILTHIFIYACFIPILYLLGDLLNTIGDLIHQLRAERNPNSIHYKPKHKGSRHV